MSPLVTEPYRHVIVATDGSHLSSLALRGGSLLASKLAAELHVFHAASRERDEALVEDQVRELLGTRAFELVTRDVVGSPSRMIADYVEEIGDAAITAIGTHGRGGVRTAVLGSTAVDLVARAGLTILAYGPRAEPPTDIVRVVACVDGSEFSEASLTEGMRWATALDVPIWLVQVVPPNLPSYVTVFESTYVRNLGQDLGMPKGRIEWDVLHSANPAQSIVNAHGSDPATLMVMATHGRLGLERVLLGSVSTQVVNNAWGPVVLIHPQIAGEPAE